MNYDATVMTRWWQLKSFVFSPLKIGEMIHFDLRIFFRWVGKQPATRYNVIQLGGGLPKPWFTVGTPPKVNTENE